MTLRAIPDFFRFIFLRVFSTKHMVREDLRRGEITPSREAYATSLRMVLPAVAEMVSAAFLGMVDTAMVGRLGPYAVSAVGLTNQPRYIFLSVFIALNIGVTAIVSRRKGQGEQEDARLVVRQAILIEAALALALTFAAIAASTFMMRLAGANDDTLEASVTYFSTVNVGLVFQALMMVLCASQRGVGNTRITMVVSLSANVVNVIMNFLLIEGRLGFPRLEVRGAAISGVIAFAVGFALAAFSYIKKDAYLRFSLADNWRPHFATIKNIMRVCFGSMVEQLVLRFGFFFYARVVAELGTAAFAAHQIAMQLMNLSFTFADGIGVATTSLVGQNLGKKRPDLSIMYGNIGQRLAFAVAVALMALSIAGRNFFPTLFTADDGIIHTTAGIIIISAFIQPIQTSSVVVSGSLRGAGDTRFVALTMLVSVAILRPITSILLIFVLGLGLKGAWFAIMFDMSVRFLMVFMRFIRGRWINIQV